MGQAMALSLVGLLALATAPAAAELKVIYGNDDRSEARESQARMLRRLSDSTVALFPGGAVTVDEESGRANLRTSEFKSARVQLPDSPFSVFAELCDDEPFKGQGKGAFCSGSLVAPDLVLTAGHCITDLADCRDTKFVFGFRADGKGRSPGSVPAGEVYGCSELVGRQLDGGGADWAVVKLDKAVADHPPLRVRREGAPPAGTPLAAIGHPSGLPTKITNGASIRRDGQGGFFVANLDTYGGNSGSAVFNEVTGEIEGILVRGDTDFEFDAERGCARSVRRMNDTGRGEDVTLVSEALESIPRPPLNLVKSEGGAMAELRALADVQR